MRVRKPGFTLIELLIVVAIIAILAAIAVPNFLEAQVRSKVSRVKADQRSYATALEAYCVDNNEYPPMLIITMPLSFSYVTPEKALIPLSTPVSYLTDALFTEPFNGKKGFLCFRSWSVKDQGLSVVPPRNLQPLYLYLSLPKIAEENLNIFVPLLAIGAASIGMSPVPTTGELEDLCRRRWWIISPGPDTFYKFDQTIGGGDVVLSVVGEIVAATMERGDGIYDPTNGTVSVGEITRSEKGVFEKK